MWEKKRTYTFTHSNSAPASPFQARYARTFRNLPRDQLGGVIFGCTNATIRECLEKQLVGLPGQHISYVKNVNPGLPVFLFNYSDKKLHGIFEAASSGQMQINPYAWTSDSSEKTQYPAQVRIRVRLYCQPLSEDIFKPIILDNYYTQHHFWFELDFVQSSKLISQLSTLAYAPSSTPHYPAPPRSIIQDSPANYNTAENVSFEPQDLENKSFSSIDSQDSSEEKNFICMKLKELALERELSALPTDVHAEKSTNAGMRNNNDVSIGQAGFLEPQPPGEEKNEEDTSDSADYAPFIAQLLEEVKELKDFKEQHTQKMSGLEKKLANAQEEIKLLKSRCLMLESTNPSRTHDGENVVKSDDLVYNEGIILAGGYDGNSWLSALDLYSPLNDVLKSLKPMSSFRSYFAIASLRREVYVFGGQFGNVRYKSVESYNPADNKWTVHPCLSKRVSNLSGATLKDKIFAMGGGNGTECFSGVEMYDPRVGRWIPSRSMWKKRFSLAAAELNGAIYAVGGFDGNNYLATAERFDPREHAWTRIESMSTKRASHALVPLGGKLYVDFFFLLWILYLWLRVMSLRVRGGVLSERITCGVGGFHDQSHFSSCYKLLASWLLFRYALGGFDGSKTMSSVEIYDPRCGTWMIGEPMNYSRMFSAAAVLKESIYVIGGAESDNEAVNMIERYNEGQGWEITNSSALRKRDRSSAIVLEED